MSERIRGSYDDALYKSTFTLLYLLTYFPNTVFVSVGNTKQPNVYEAANRIVRTGDVYIQRDESQPICFASGSGSSSFRVAAMIVMISDYVDCCTRC